MPRKGLKTKKELDKYLENYKIPKWPGYFGPLPPVIDFARNYTTMRSKNLDLSDKFFHCKANYEALTRGKYGSAIAKELSDLRENFDQKIKGDSLKSSQEDMKANFRGRHGAAMKKSLKATCPTDYRKYK